MCYSNLLATVWGRKIFSVLHGHSCAQNSLVWRNLSGLCRALPPPPSYWMPLGWIVIVCSTLGMYYSKHLIIYHILATKFVMINHLNASMLHSFFLSRPFFIVLLYTKKIQKNILNKIIYPTFCCKIKMSEHYKCLLNEDPYLKIGYPKAIFSGTIFCKIKNMQVLMHQGKQAIFKWNVRITDPPSTMVGSGVVNLEMCFLFLYILLAAENCMTCRWMHWSKGYKFVSFYFPFSPQFK